jgi:hypothetical protein
MQYDSKCVETEAALCFLLLPPPPPLLLLLWQVP